MEQAEGDADLWQRHVLLGLEIVLSGIGVASANTLHCSWGPARETGESDQEGGCRAGGQVRGHKPMGRPGREVLKPSDNEWSQEALRVGVGARLIDTEGQRKEELSVKGKMGAQGREELVIPTGQGTSGGKRVKALGKWCWLQGELGAHRCWPRCISRRPLSPSPSAWPHRSLGPA